MAKNITDDNFNEKDAFDFEASRNYLFIKSNKRAWAVATVSLVVTLILSLAVVFLTPLKTVELAVVKVDKNGFVDIVTQLDEQVITTDEAIDKHFIGRYIKTREQYYFGSLNKDFETVQMLSSPDVSQKYINEMVNKKTGRAEVYKDKQEVDVHIISIVLNKKVDEFVATIRVETVERDVKNTTGVNTIKVITLTYEYLPIKLNTKSRLENPLGFVVTSYRVDEEIKE